MSHRVTVKRWTYVNAQRHVTAFRPISVAAHGWSYDIDAKQPFANFTLLRRLVKRLQWETMQSVESVAYPSVFAHSLYCFITAHVRFVPRKARQHFLNSTRITVNVRIHFIHFTLYRGWLGSRVVSVLDSGAVGPGFKSQSRRCRVTVLDKLFTPIVPLIHQAAKLVAALLRVARVTAGLAKSNSSLPPGLWLTSPAGWLPSTGIISGTLR